MSWYRIELDSVVIYKFGWIQTSQTGGQPYSDTSPYKENECSLQPTFHDARQIPLRRLQL